MEDHHVDRPGVEAQQCVKLTGTNSSIGFIALIIPVHPERMNIGQHDQHDPAGQTPAAKDLILRSWTANACHELLPFAGLVVMAGRNAPDPIPNSAVKLPSANGTPSQDAGE